MASLVVSYLILSAIIAIIYLIIYQHLYEFREGDTIIFLLMVTVCWPLLIIFDTFRIIFHFIKLICHEHQH